VTGNLRIDATRRELIAVAGFLLAATRGWAAKSHITKSRITAITDEIGLTQADAIAFAKHYNLQWVELRYIPGTTKEFAALTTPELKRYAAELGGAKLKVSTLYVTTLDPASQAAGVVLGADRTIVMKADSGPVRVNMLDNRNWKAFFEKLQRENYQGEISLQTTPGKADDAMRELMHIVGEL
jgi:hypothetical protein